MTILPILDGESAASVRSKLNSLIQAVNLYYVSSVNGSDANSGLSVSEQKQTIGALPSTAQFISLESGSHFREQLTILNSVCRVRRHGDGPVPLIDGSDLVTGSWALNGTNLWDLAVATEPRHLYLTRPVGWVGVSRGSAAACVDRFDWFYDSTAKTITVYSPEAPGNCDRILATVLGADVLITDAWEKELTKPHLWKVTVTGTVTRLVFNGIRAIRAWTRSAVSQDDQFAWVAGTLTLFAIVTPATYYTKVESTVRLYGIFALEKTNVEIVGVKVRKAVHGVYLDECSSWLIDGCDVGQSMLDGINLNCTDTVGFTHHVLIQNGSSRNNGTNPYVECVDKTWTDNGGSVANTWYCSLPYEVRSGASGETGVIFATPAGVETISTTAQASIAALDADNEWFWDLTTKRLYIFSTAAPVKNTTHAAIRARVIPSPDAVGLSVDRGLGVAGNNGASDITIRNMTLEANAEDGVQPGPIANSRQCNRWAIYDSRLRFNFEDGIDCKSGLGHVIEDSELIGHLSWLHNVNLTGKQYHMRAGIFSHNNTEDVTVRRSRFARNGINLRAEANPQQFTADRNVFGATQIENISCKGGGTAGTRPCTITNNLIEESGTIVGNLGCIEIDGDVGNVLTGNTIVSFLGKTASIMTLTNVGSITMKSNLVVGTNVDTGKRIWDYPSSSLAGGITADYNGFFVTNAVLNYLRYRGTTYSAAQFLDGTWETASGTGADANSTDTNPTLDAGYTPTTNVLTSGDPALLGTTPYRGAVRPATPTTGAVQV